VTIDIIAAADGVHEIVEAHADKAEQGRRLPKRLVQALRDAHLGSIWEGTSNIVALDVLRAAKRDGALPALRAHVDTLLADGEPCPAAAAALQAGVVDRAFALAADAAAADRAELARQAATALYNVTTMAALRWEARRAGLPYRGRLADRVLRHRLARRDPLGAPAGADDDGEIEPAAG
jgi:hypothetical protein